MKVKGLGQILKLIHFFLHYIFSSKCADSIICNEMFALNYKNKKINKNLTSALLDPIYS